MLPSEVATAVIWHRPETALVVLDTNAVLDWLLFRNPEMDELGAAIAAGDLQWVATGSMRDELAQVLARGHLDDWRPDPSMIWAKWALHCSESAEPGLAAPLTRPRCTEPDDQKFVDLAVCAGARWLISRDRAVLKLAGRLRRLGVAVMPPGRWSAPLTPVD